ncbi:hypothetical protein [Primorskyibacter sp. 2E233]|uniref:hypothetical protein n=1 Tax=Primorskyibacter sp. 2E233 TaxID=3413431 RepID=UPI003BF3CEA4
MIRRLRAAFRRHPILTSGFTLALLLTLFFSGRLVVHSFYWADPTHRDEQIAGWMTPGYVAHSWHVPPEIIGGALGFTRETIVQGQTLDELAEARDVPFDQLAKDLEAAILEFRTTRND